MDLKKLLGNDLLADIGKAVNGKADSDTITKVLGAALPAIVENKSKEETAARKSTPDKKGLSDAAGILFDLLGDNSSSVTQSVSESTGVSQNQVISILSAAAPFLLKLFGSSSSSNNSSSILSMVTGLLGDKDEKEEKEDNSGSGILSMVTGLLGDKDEKEEKEDNSNSDGDSLGSIVNLAASILGNKK